MVEIGPKKLAVDEVASGPLDHVMYDCRSLESP
jgi:hypothetical protein